MSAFDMEKVIKQSNVFNDLESLPSPSIKMIASFIIWIYYAEQDG